MVVQSKKVNNYRITLSKINFHWELRVTQDKQIMKHDYIFNEDEALDAYDEELNKRKGM